MGYHTWAQGPKHDKENQLECLNTPAQILLTIRRYECKPGMTITNYFDTRQEIQFLCITKYAYPVLYDLATGEEYMVLGA